MLNLDLKTVFIGVAMGSHLGPVVANIFVGYFESILLSIKPLNYFRYVDDTFISYKKNYNITALF